MTISDLTAACYSMNSPLCECYDWSFFRKNVMQHIGGKLITFDLQKISSAYDLAAEMGKQVGHKIGNPQIVEDLIFSDCGFIENERNGFILFNSNNPKDKSFVIECFVSLVNLASRMNTDDKHKVSLILVTT